MQAEQNVSNERSPETFCTKCSNINNIHDDDTDDIGEDDDDNGIASNTPSDFNSSDHLFHINFLRTIQHIPPDIKRFLWKASTEYTKKSVKF